MVEVAARDGESGQLTDCLFDQGGGCKVVGIKMLASLLAAVHLCVLGPRAGGLNWVVGLVGVDWRCKHGIQ